MTIENECRKAVMQVRASALRDAPFYGTVAMGMEIIICEEYQGRKVDTLATDGTHLFVNPGYFMDKSHGKRKSCILHETMHKALGHHLRRGDRDFYWWNIACDEAVNILLLDSGQEIDKDWVCTPEKYRGWTAERVYADIVQPPKQGDGRGGRTRGDKTGPGEGKKEVGQGDDKPDDPKSDDTKGDDPKTDRKPLQSEVWDATNEDGSEKDAKEMEKASRDHAKNISQARDVERTAGTSSSASFDRAMDEVMSPSASWETLLAAWWSETGEPSNETWRRFNRRAMMAGMFMPDTEKRSLNHIVMGFDVSSSVGLSEQSEFVSQINNLREAMPCKLITVVPFNTVVQKTEIVEIEPWDEVPNRFKVGGGTRFAPVFNWVRRLDKAPDAVIMFTDLGSSDHGEDPGCKVMWASSVPVWDGDGYSNRPPFGEVIEVEVR